MGEEEGLSGGGGGLHAQSVFDLMMSHGNGCIMSSMCGNAVIFGQNSMV